ncbi:DUF4397 domain-containing protein [Natronorubrum tibetense]|uniref:DUF4397 domain-containing protein n=1 Tax=Natronorubrum tibetense GA33 TaxID=1114856 RepID=L9W046_9EURY|nr:DUF4397 domain-containing protein [Natronorubrum tibetense]ELY42874.1 hypothetical protein C496_06057 [Natronorubrum tibetense GA33]
MTLSRRSTIKAIGIVGGGSALSGTALAVNEHEDDERDVDEEPDDGEMGAIRVGHFSPDAPNVDVYVDDQQILTDVAYDELSPYLEIAPGTYTLTITAAGDDEPVYEENIPVDTDYYTAAAIGEIEGDDGDDEVEGAETAASVQDDDYEDDDYEDVDDEDDDYEDVDDEDDDYEDVDDDYDDADDDLEEEAVDDEDDEDGPGTFDVLLLFDREAVEQEGTSQLRLVHASPDAPTLDITDDQGLPLYEDVGFGEPSGYVSFEPGEQTLELFEAGENEFDAEFDEDDLEDQEDEETEEPETAASIQDDEDDDLDLDDEDDDLDEDEVIDQAEPLSSVDVDLEEDTVYTAFAIGYFEERDDLDDDRPFEIRVAIDGEEEEEDDHDEAPDEAEPDEDEVDNGEDDYEDDPDVDDDDDYEDDDDDGYDDYDDDDGYDDEEEEEPMTADD